MSGFLIEDSAVELLIIFHAIRGIVEDKVSVADDAKCDDFD